MLAHSQVVVRTPDGDRSLFSVEAANGPREASRLALQIREDPIASLLLQGRQTVAEKAIVIHKAESAVPAPKAQGRQRRKLPAPAGRQMKRSDGLFGCDATAVHPLRGLFQRLAEALEKLVDLVLADDQRRAEGDGITQVAYDQAIGLAALEEVEADAAHRLEAGLGLLVGYQLHGRDQADPAHLADEGMIREAAQALLEARRDGGRVLYQLALLDDLQVLETHRRCHRMGAGGEAMAEGAELLGVVGKG